MRKRPSLYPIICVLIFSCNWGQLSGQSHAQLRQQAATQFANKAWKQAIFSYKNLYNQKNKPNYQYQIAQCYLALNDYPSALEYLNKYLKYKKHKDEALFYTAYALHHQKDWANARRLYKLYLRTVQNSPLRAAAKQLLLQTLYAEKLLKQRSPVIISTAGDAINSRYDETPPVASPRFKDLYFFSQQQLDKESQELQFDIFTTQKKQGQWLEVSKASQRYNSPADEVVFALPGQGYQLLYFRGQLEASGFARIDNYEDGFEEALDVPFAEVLASASWTGDHCFFGDSLVVYAAQRQDSYGGKDLYYRQLLTSGQWSSPVNLGPSINSSFDERSPFLAKDGKTLYFSSNRPQSLGGFDIFRSHFSDTTAQWTKPQNLGYPTNDAGDELYFQLDQDGLQAMMSSERAGGKGGLDVYAVYFRQHRPEQQREDLGKSFARYLNNLNLLAEQIKATPNELINQLDPNNTNTSAKQRYELGPVFYDGQTGEFLPAAAKRLQALQALLLNHPKVKVLLTAHSDPENKLENNLFLTVQQADLLAKQLIQAGVKAEQIYLRGCAQQYPLAQNYNFNGSPNATGQQLNRRIDISVYNTKNLPIQIKLNRPTVSSVMMDTLAKNYEDRLKGLSYKIQLMQSPALYSHPILEQVGHSSAEKLPQKANITYCLGLSKNFSSIVQLLETARETGFGQAKIVPYVNGYPISLEEAAALDEVYPDLQEYLEFEGE